MAVRLSSLAVQSAVVASVLWLPKLTSVWSAYDRLRSSGQGARSVSTVCGKMCSS